MANPWLKKNPLMSMWLSSANSVAGSLRGRATAQARRAATTATTTATRELFKIWTGAAATPVSAPTKTRKRRKR